MPAKTDVKSKPTSTEVTETLRKNGGSVYYEKSVTKNLGNFESAKVTVGITLPIAPTVEEITEYTKTIEIADGIVTDELEVQLKEITEKK
jgi:hypothetical protein